ncbi:MAG: hypothetical protein R3A13_06485 [Bdellovibrionota bacterium]
MSREKGNTIVSIIIGITVFSGLWVTVVAVFDWIQTTKAARMGYGQEVYHQESQKTDYSPNGYTVKY